MSTTSPVALSNLEQVAGRISQLKEMLQSAAPGYESLLHTIHVALAKDDELSHLLSEEQIGVICLGLSKKKGIVIATQTVKSGKSASGKSLKNIDVSDL